MSKHEALILKRYENGYERVEIIEELTQEYMLEYSQAEIIVEAALLRNKNMKRRKVGAKV